MELQDFAAVIVSALALLFAYYQFSRKVHNEDTSRETTMLIKLENISEGIGEIKSDMRNMRQDMSELRERIAACEASAKSAHRRLDEVIGKHD